MRKFSWLLLFSLLLASLSGCSTTAYYYQAAKGQFGLLKARQPVDSLLAQADLDRELRQQLETAKAVRTFAEQQLHLPVGGSFRHYVALDRPWVLVNLVVVPEFSLTPHTWCYPIVGCQAYRGYFDLAMAERAAESFRAKNFDVLVAGVTAYSTLGWFNDPLHSGFTRLPEDRMVALMIHELSHQLIYIRGDTTFNESFATAVELEGLKRWLDAHGDSRGFVEALQRLTQREITLALVRHASARLQDLYELPDLGDEDRRAAKTVILKQLQADYDGLARHWPQPGPFGRQAPDLSNAHLALFQQYNTFVPGFRQLLREHDGDFPRFYDAVRALGRQPKAARHAALHALNERFDEHF
ncbi:MAG: aminopeptidase [Marinobacter sp.]|nr:aminopeptidase [Marinobacter sp.]